MHRPGEPRRQAADQSFGILPFQAVRAGPTGAVLDDRRVVAGAPPGGQPGLPGEIGATSTGPCNCTSLRKTNLSPCKPTAGS
jgi:hypothetical protein